MFLGRLVRGDEPRVNLKVGDVDKELLLNKAIAIELDAKVLDAMKKADDKKKQQEKLLFDHMTSLVDEEVKFSKINKLKLLSDWRIIMRIAKIDELRKQIDLYLQNFERELDNKDAILHMLDKDIEEAEEHYGIALTNHFIHIRQLTQLQDSRIKGLFKEFDRDVAELEGEFNTETSHIKANFESEQIEINNMIKHIKKEYQIKIDNVIDEFKRYNRELEDKNKNTYTKIQEKIKKVASNEAQKFTNDVNDIKAKSQEKSNQDDMNIKLLTQLEREIAFRKKRVDKNNEILKQLKIKIKQNDDDWESKIKSLKAEKHKIILSYKELKKKLIEFRNNQVIFILTLREKN
jgi:hypothetical protein